MFKFAYLFTFEKMEKFCLRWNDFQMNASNAFNKLRKDKDFLDITLVSEDGEHISAHKVVLSASSDFFKDTLKMTNHPNPMFFLSGFHSTILTAVLDYVYNGEVNIFQEEIDEFLKSAEKLKIDGLTRTMEEQDSTAYAGNELIGDSYLKEEENSMTKFSHEAYPLQNQNSDAKMFSSGKKEVYKYDEYFTSCESGWKCNTCGKIASLKKNMKQHVELHMDGLSFPCQHCNQSFRSRNLLKHHKTMIHKQLK